jgi:hypothetical protein
VLGGYVAAFTVIEDGAAYDIAVAEQLEIGRAGAPQIVGRDRGRLAGTVAEFERPGIRFAPRQRLAVIVERALRAVQRLAGLASSAFGSPTGDGNSHGPLASAMHFSTIARAQGGSGTMWRRELLLSVMVHVAAPRSTSRLRMAAISPERCASNSSSSSARLLPSSMAARGRSVMKPRISGTLKNVGSCANMPDDYIFVIQHVTMTKSCGSKRLR